jgi:peptidoglycan hydrolase-like protein with peptidoglycan-binding domain
MDATKNHLEAKEGTSGPSVFILKCIFLGTKFDLGYALDTFYDDKLQSTVRSFQAKYNIASDGNFGQETRKKLFQILNINLDDIPHTVLSVSDLALQPSGEIFQWPPSQIIIPFGNKNLRTSEGYYKLLPPYLDWPGAHNNPVGATMGTSVFIAKCLFLGTEYYRSYSLNTQFCNILAETIRVFQSANGLEMDSCFGQDSRRVFNNIYGRDLEAIPRQVLLEPNRALQPDGSLLSWPPAIIIA